MRFRGKEASPAALLRHSGLQGGGNVSTFVRNYTEWPCTRLCTMHIVCYILLYCTIGVRVWALALQTVYVRMYRLYSHATKPDERDIVISIIC